MLGCMDKRCTRCGGPRDAKNKSQKSGLDPQCKKCHREKQQERRDAGLNQKRERAYKLRKKYGLSEEEWKHMLEEQRSSCAICHVPFVEAPYNGRICVDHNHKTGKVRGLLCVDCNHGLGKFKDRTSLLMGAIHYLNQHAGSGVTHNG
jgi:nitrate/TMAO reductase-like tetraheme cytochrome c subunit